MKRLASNLAAPKTSFAAAPCRAYMIIEAMVYIGVLMILFGVGYATLYRCLQNSTHLRTNADQIAKVLQVGELWRADVRASGPSLHVEQNDSEQILQLSSKNHQISYRFATNHLFRRIDSNPWVPLLTRVKASSMHSDQGKQILSCRWELELDPYGKRGRMRPLFTFIAAPHQKGLP